ncbi:ferredoxin-type protein NapF [Vibrio sp. 404]|uniref:Ferredoxin-type protein NapF n=1 Tax=Vibrio marinisediminis TaxID=2758441 RepID=A0A7W2FP80_9VIBR|nr:ferredoxin-type protein NapF [Vibrio marinisediminis]MBA5761713.1 ferredoxin-type protein NapF [Vibrio marinisediminis]
MVDLSRRRLFTRKTASEDTLRLPWLNTPKFFTDLCTQCGECLKACETQIIVKGDGGFPQVDFTIDECTFCYQCADACPEPLFLSKQEAPWQAKASINEQCLAQRNVECRSCSEMCESVAIQFQLEVGRVAQPKLDTQLCNGCGACVSVCPTLSINVSNFVV